MGVWKIYKISNQSSGRAYIGITSKPIEMRFREHIANAEQGTRLHKNGTRYALHAALVKYGSERFDLVELKKRLDLDSARRLETELIKKYNTYASAKNLPNLPRGYNETLGGEMPDASELAYAAHLERLNASAANKGNVKTKKSAPIAKSRDADERPSVSPQPKSRPAITAPANPPSTYSDERPREHEGSTFGFFAFTVLAIILLLWLA